MGWVRAALWDETLDHCLELIAPVVAPGEAGEIASGMVGAELAISPGDRALDVAERRVHPFERCHAGRLSARPGTDRPLGTSNNYALRGSGGRNRPFFVSFAVIRASIGVFEGLHRPLSGGAGIRIPRLAGQAVTQPQSWTRRRRL